MNNAFHHCNEGGTVTCKVHYDDQLRIDVTNTGSHIADVDLPHLYKRAFRGSASTYPGSGIGLAWTKQIVELHAGTIRVDNAQKGHVTFSVTIPAISFPDKPVKLPEVELESRVSESEGNV